MFASEESRHPCTAHLGSLHRVDRSRYLGDEVNVCRLHLSRLPAMRVQYVIRRPRSPTKPLWEADDNEIRQRSCHTYRFHRRRPVFRRSIRYIARQVAAADADRRPNWSRTRNYQYNQPCQSCGGGVADARHGVSFEGQQRSAAIVEQRRRELYSDCTPPSPSSSIDRSKSEDLSFMHSDHWRWRRFIECLDDREDRSTFGRVILLSPSVTLVTFSGDDERSSTSSLPLNKRRRLRTEREREREREEERKIGCVCSSHAENGWCIVRQWGSEVARWFQWTQTAGVVWNKILVYTWHVLTEKIHTDTDVLKYFDKSATVLPHRPLWWRH